MAVMAARKRAAKKRQLSVSQQFVLEKMKHVFDDVLSTNPNDFLHDDGEGNTDYILQLWDCFADVYPKVQALKPGVLSLEDKRQIVADLMVWSSIEASDQATKRFVLEPHLQDSFFLSIGQTLREAMADRGLLALKDKDSAISVDSDVESQGSNWESLNAEDHCEQDQEHSSGDTLTGSS